VPGDVSQEEATPRSSHDRKGRLATVTVLDNRCLRKQAHLNLDLARRWAH
jgi:hypothetical protein